MTRPEPDWTTVNQFIQEHPDGGDFQEIADVFGFSHQRCQQLVARAIQKVFTKLIERRILDIDDLI